MKSGNNFTSANSNGLADKVAVVPGASKGILVKMAKPSSGPEITRRTYGALAGIGTRQHAPLLFFLLFATALLKLHAQPQLSQTNTPPQTEAHIRKQPKTIWENGIGNGLRSSAQSLTLSAGATYGIAAFGGHEAHDLALASFTYGHMLKGVVGEGHWYRGNPEFRLELFTGAQFAPGSEWLVGLTPHLRYDFATGTRWIPFVDAGAGVTATGIGPPDLSGTFEFNLQAGGGVLWYLKDNMALTVNAHYLHFSCAGLHAPNLGLNGVTGMLGITYFF